MLQGRTAGRPFNARPHVTIRTPRCVWGWASALVEEWSNISQQQLANLSQFIEMRCKVVHKAWTHHILTATFDIDPCSGSFYVYTDIYKQWEFWWKKSIQIGKTSICRFNFLNVNNSLWFADLLTKVIKN